MTRKTTGCRYHWYVSWTCCNVSPSTRISAATADSDMFVQLCRTISGGYFVTRKETGKLWTSSSSDLTCFTGAVLPQARRSDLDMNHHVNNVAYFGWMLESVPESVVTSHELASITLEYRRECISDDIVESLTSAEPAESTQSQQV
jgi:hypothetical protein